MGKSTTSKNATPTAVPIDKLYMENTLLRVFGVLFCHDPKRARTRTGKIEITRGSHDKDISIRLDTEYRQPGPFAHKIALAIIKKQSAYGRPIRQDVSFSQRELLHLSGRKTLGGRDSDELVQALKQIRYTHIITKFKRDGRFVEHDFSIFNEILIERRESPSDPIAACSVTLADPIVRSLEDQHFTCLNHTLMQQLGTIGQALYMRLFFHFANLYQDHPRRRPTFSKRYDDICAEWLGGLTVHNSVSTIERDQLGPHLQQLKRVNFLASYNFDLAARGDGLVLSFRPGPTFISDYENFYLGRQRGHVQFEFHDDRAEIAEPLKVAYLFTEKRTGQAVTNIPYVSSREVQTARELLTHIPFAEISDFIDYALREARKTRFDIQSLGGLKQYVPRYHQALGQRAASKAAAAAQAERQQHEESVISYDRFRRTLADALFANLPEEEQRLIEDLARDRARGPMATKDGPLAATLFHLARARITADRHPNQIPTLEAWKAERRAPVPLH